MAESRKRTSTPEVRAGAKPGPGAPQPGGPGDDPAPSTPGDPGADPAKDPGPDTTPQPAPETEPDPEVRKFDGPGGAPPNAAQLKRDHESGAHRDKIAYPDPGASPLGTDDEAAGRPAEHERERVAMSRASAPGSDQKPFEPLQSAPRADPADDPAPRVDTSGRFQFLVFGGVLVAIIAALILRMILG